MQLDRAVDAHRLRGSETLTLRAPRKPDGARIWALIRSIEALDDNSMYCNLLQCSHFASTCALAEIDGKPVGWISGYLPPEKPDTLFVWQVARAIGSHLGISLRRKRREGTKVVMIKSETQQGTELEVEDVTVLGRSPEADVLLDDPYASEFHMRLVAQENGMVLHDLGSTNGTYINGRRVTAPTTLRRGDNIQVGKTVMEVR